MNRYSFTFTSLSDVTKTVYITAETFAEAEAKFWQDYGYSVDKFFKVSSAKCG